MPRSPQRRLPSPVGPLGLLAVLAPTLASADTLVDAYEAAYDNVSDGEWYRDRNDDDGPLLANHQSYVMLSLAVMYQATGDSAYLDRLAFHADGVLAQRNDNRGVSDYRGEESPCWRETWYSGGGMYCWTLHSGQIIEGPLQFAWLVDDADLGEQVAYDGVSFADKADAYVIAAQETVAFHNADWDDAGWYVIAQDTGAFLGDEAGTVLPMNQSNAMGIPLLLLYDLTGDAVYLDQATALAARFYDGLGLMTWGGYAWTYYLDDVLDYGEDIAHASFSVRFAIALWQREILFADHDMDRMVNILRDVTIDDRTFWHALNGRALTNYLDYQASLYEWLPLTAFDPVVYTTVRNLFALSYPAEDLTDGARLNGWAHLAAHALPECTPTLVAEDWEDLGDGWHQALTTSPRLSLPVGEDCAAPLMVDSDGEVVVTGDEQIAVWQATGEALERWMPVAGEGAEVVSLVHESGVSLRLQGGSKGGDEETEATGAGCRSVGGAMPAMLWVLGVALLARRRRPRAALGVLLVGLGCSGGTKDPGTSGADGATVDTGSDGGSDSGSNSGAADGGTDGGADGGTTGDAGTTDTGDTGDTGTLPPEPLIVASVTTGTAHSCGLLADGQVRCWGSNASGQLEVPDLEFAQIEAGAYHTCGVTTDGELACWGWRATDVGAPDGGSFVLAAGALMHSAAITAEGTVLAWGPNSKPITTSEPGGIGASDLSCGQFHCVLRRDDGNSVTWGGPYYVFGGGGDRAYLDLDAGAHSTCGVTELGQLACWGYDTSGQVSPPETGTWTAVSCGGTHCCALDESGLATCWGADHAGQSAAPDSTFVGLSAGGQHTCGWTEDGTVDCWGNDAQGQCTVPSADGPAED